MCLFPVITDFLWVWLIMDFNIACDEHSNKLVTKIRIQDVTRILIQHVMRSDLVQGRTTVKENGVAGSKNTQPARGWNATYICTNCVYSTLPPELGARFHFFGQAGRRSLPLG